MQLQDLNETYLRQFAGSTIFQRGKQYAERGMVSSLNYDAVSDSIQAEVTGNYGDYDVTVSTQSGQLSAECDCPYDGYPCKHIVATLLQFMTQKSSYFRQAKTQKKAESSLVKKIKALPHDQLLDILLDCVKKYPDVKRDLMVRLESDTKTTFSSIKKQIARAFPSIQSRNYSTSQIAKQLRMILKSVENAPSEMQLKVYWAVTDRTLDELNDYGMDDDALENIVIEMLEELVDAFQGNDSLQQEKADIITQLMKYYLQGNFGLTDWVYETAYKLCSQKSDYMILIDSLKGKVRQKASSSYHKELLADLYGTIGDTEAQRSTLESRLEYGMDYWRLAQYWTEQGQAEKALQVIREGIEKGQGRKIELYAALQEQYRKQGDYEGIFKLLLQKVERQDLDNRNHFTHDNTYNCLWEHYSEQGEYQGIAKLLEMRLQHNDIDLRFYQEAEANLTQEDWNDFAPRIRQNLQERIQNKQQRGPHMWYVPYAAEETKILAEIYEYSGDINNLFETIKHDVKLLREYEARLLPSYPVEYLAQYRNIIDRLIATRGRDNYKTAAQYAATIKRIYLDIQHEPAAWKQYINSLLATNKQLRALKEEFANL